MAGWAAGRGAGMSADAWVRLLLPCCAPPLQPLGALLTEILRWTKGSNPRNKLVNLLPACICPTGASSGGTNKEPEAEGSCRWLQPVSHGHVVEGRGGGWQ